jgi:endonuclease YncB( thermonuclease family)
VFDSELTESLIDKRTNPETGREVINDTTYGEETLWAKVVDIYDGDTIRIRFRRFGKLEQWKVRTMGYDSPEMKPDKKDKDGNPRSEAEIEAEKTDALAARDALRKKLNESDCMVYFTVDRKGWDKYGRLLGTLYVPQFRCLQRQPGENLSEWMIKNRYGYAYGGGTKATFVLEDGKFKPVEKTKPGNADEKTEPGNASEKTKPVRAAPKVANNLEEGLMRV